MKITVMDCLSLGEAIDRATMAYHKIPRPEGIQYVVQRSTLTEIVVREATTTFVFQIPDEGW